MCAESHCILGIFGDTDKAGRVVPYKAYQAMASNRPLITALGPATRNLAAEGLLLVPPGDPQQLAEAILDLASQHSQGSIPSGTRALYDKTFSQRAMREQLEQGLAVL